MNNWRLSIYKSIWFCWLLTTLIYVVLAFLGYPKTEIATPLGYVAGFVGLFVPYGLASLILFANPFTWISLLVFLILMFCADRELKRKSYSLVTAILINLLLLLIITIIIDWFRQTPLASWTVFLHGAHPRYWP